MGDGLRGYGRSLEGCIMGRRDDSPYVGEAIYSKTLWYPFLSSPPKVDLWGKIKTGTIT